MISCSRMSWMRGSTSPRVGSRITRPSGGSAPMRSRKSGIGGGLSCRFSLHQLQAARPILDRHRVAGLEQHARDVAGLAVDHDVAVATSWRAAARIGAKPRRWTTLSSRRSRMRQQLLAGVLRRARGQLEVAAELALEDAVEALELLLLAEADAVLARLAAAVAVHAGRRRCGARWRTWGFRSGCP